MPSLAPLTGIADHHRLVEAALRLFYSPDNPQFDQRFFAYRESELALELAEELAETDRHSALVALARVEAALRRDYDFRRGSKLADAVSVSFRRIGREREERARLVDDLLETWKDNVGAGDRSLIGVYKAMIRYRHWLAHGRHWNVGRTYSFQDVYAVADALLTGLPLLP